MMDKLIHVSYILNISINYIVKKKKELSQLLKKMNLLFSEYLFDLKEANKTNTFTCFY